MIKLHYYEIEYYLNEKFICSVNTKYDKPITTVTMINGDEFKCIEKPDEVLKLIEEKESRSDN